MNKWTYEKETKFNFEHITIYKRLCDGVQTGWMMEADNGYVFYDTTANNTYVDAQSGIVIPIVYYYRSRYLNLNRDFNTFPFVAVQESTVSADNIF